MSKDTKDEFGQRIKSYEAIETARRIDVTKPIVIRLDGKAFHTFTRGLKRPYDERLSQAMIETTKCLVDKLHATIGYTQSDEISLVFWADPSTSAQFLYGGKIHKLVSLSAGLASSKLVSLLPEYLPEKVGKLPYFDSRVIRVPDKSEAVNALLWRVFDAEKNSISMAAQSVYSHRTLQGKNGREMIEMLKEKGIVWSEYPTFFKRGTFVQRRSFQKVLAPEVLAKIPEDRRPSGPVTRSEVVVLDMPRFVDVTNRIGVVFDAEDPTHEDPNLAL